MKALIIAVLTFPLMGAIEGVVVNGTSGRPQPGVTVTLLELSGAGMKPVGTAKSDKDGKFGFEGTLESPQLLQTIFEGVTYSRMLQAGESNTGIQVEVFNASPRPGDTTITQHMVLLEPSPEALAVSEAVIFENPGKVSFVDPKNGTLRVYLPAAAQGKVNVRVTAPGGMPVQRAAQKTGQPNVYKVDFPIKPGETRFDLNYTEPAATPQKFSGRILHKLGSTRLVVPNGVTLKGEGLEVIGVEPSSQARIYNLTKAEFEVEVEGSGSLRTSAPANDEDSGPGIEQILPRVYDRLYWIIGLGLTILALGFITLYRAQTSRRK